MKTYPTLCIFSTVCICLSIAAAVFFAACSTSKTTSLGPVMPESDDPVVVAEQYRESYEKWVGRKLRAYTMVFSYGAFSPFAGVWEVDVVDGRVTRRVFKDQVLGEDTPSMADMNMERLFAQASAATNTRRDGPFIVRASFYRDGGVASVRRVLNPASGAASSPRDATWAFEVREIRALQE